MAGEASYAARTAAMRTGSSSAADVPRRSAPRPGWLPWAVAAALVAVVVGLGWHSHQLRRDLRGLEQLPARGATLLAAPMLVAGGSGAPTRVVALLP